MVFEEYARLLLVVHAFCALALVGLSTHLVIWLHRYLYRGKGARRSVVRFSLLTTLFFALTMIAGLLLYPTYKVRVRGEFLDNPAAIAAAVELDEKARVQARRRDLESLRYRTGEAGGSAPKARSDDELGARAQAEVRAGAKAARWFDVKEHWAALGFILAGACSLLLWVHKRRDDLRGLASLIVLLAAFAMATTWFAAIVGLLTAARRSV